MQASIKNIPLWLSRGRVPCLDGLRAISILLVSISHFAKASNSPCPAWFERARYLGPPAVDIFFVISGFLITMLMLREQDRNGSISLRGFYARRILRIFPAYIAFLFVLFVLTRIGALEMSGRGWLLALTYTVNFDPNPPEWIGQVWSLSVEEHFYLTWPLAVYFLSPKGSRLVLLGWIAVCPVFRGILWAHYQDKINIDQFTLTRLDTIAIGCYLAYFLRGATALRLAHWLRPWTAPAVLGAALLFVLSNVGFHSGKYDLYFKRFVEGVATAFIIFACVTNSGALICRLLEWKPMVVIGVLSYSLYLWQPLLHPPAEWRFPWYANIAATAAAAVASYLIVERPFLLLKARVSSQASDVSQPRNLEPASVNPSAS